MKCLITGVAGGGSGFVGCALIRHLLAQGYALRLPLRRPQTIGKNLGAEIIEIGDISMGTDWALALKDVDKVVHLAARGFIK